MENIDKKFADGTNKVLLTDFDFEEIRKLVTDLKEPGYRAGQLFQWLISGEDFSGMTNLSNSFRQKLSSFSRAVGIEIIKNIPSKDGSQKFLYKLFDGNIIEGVLMKYKYGNTLCVSTQVGCRMGCAFCASGIDGLIRNLSAGEIAGQVYAVNKFMGGNSQKREITNIVLMGSGEPLDNYENTLKFLKIITSKEGLNISQRNISLSTCGLTDGIYKLADENMAVNLCLSLHAPFDGIRNKIMPVSKKYDLKSVIDACKYYFEKSGRRVIFEYALIDNVNDSKECAVKLKELLKGFSAHLNIIRLNYVKEKKLKPSSKERMEIFTEELKRQGVSFTIRRTIGAEIGGACGQLRRSYSNNE